MLSSAIFNCCYSIAKLDMNRVSKRVGGGQQHCRRAITQAYDALTGLLRLAWQNVNGDAAGAGKDDARPTVRVLEAEL